jgi:hypothetical protein
VRFSILPKQSPWEMGDKQYAVQEKKQYSWVGTNCREQYTDSRSKWETLDCVFYMTYTSTSLQYSWFFNSTETACKLLAIPLQFSPDGMLIMYSILSFDLREYSLHLNLIQFMQKMSNVKNHKILKEHLQYNKTDDYKHSYNRTRRSPLYLLTRLSLRRQCTHSEVSHRALAPKL